MKDIIDRLVNNFSRDIHEVFVDTIEKKITIIILRAELQKAIEDKYKVLTKDIDRPFKLIIKMK